MRRLAVVILVLVGCSEPKAPSNPDGPPINPDAPAQTGVATGELGPWLAGPPMPTPRANHCSAVIDDWILVIGGNHAQGMGFATTDEIHAAQIRADGTLSPWQLAGHTHSPVSECNATGDQRTLYIVDGIYDNAADSRKIWTAELDATGHLGTLATTGALPDGVIAISSEVAVHGGELMVMNTEVPTGGDTTVTMRTPTSSIAWTTDDWHIGFRGRPQYAFTHDFVFTLGGYKGDTGNPTTAETFVAPIDAAGAVGTPRPGTPLPMPIAFGDAVAVDQWIFVAGGRGQILGAPGTTMVAAAKVAANGDLGAWTTPSPLPVARTNHELVVVGDYLVVTGGAAMGPGDATVLISRVRFPPAS